MPSKHFLVTGSLFLLTSEAILCRKQTPSFELVRNDETWIDYGGISWNSFISCGFFNTDSWGCHSTKWEGSYTRSRGDEVTSDWSYSSETKGCLAEAACAELAGGTDQCQYASYSWERWLPTSCDEDADYDAYTESRDVTLSLSCCTDSNYCNRDEDYSDCTENSDFSNYLDALNKCWNNFKKDFMKELLCDEEDDDIFEWAYNCTNSDGTWKSDEYSNRVCRYRATCTQDLQTLLTEYGECACDAAVDNDYSGDFISTAMEEAWESWCPGIELSCQTGDVVQVLYNYYVITYSIVLAVGVDDITEEIQNAIINAVSEYLNVHNNSITIREDTDTTRRRLQESSWNVEITVSTKNDADEIEGNIDSGLDDDVETSSGYTVSSSDTSQEEKNSTSTGNYNSGSANKQVDVSNFVLVLTFLSVFAAFVQ